MHRIWHNEDVVHQILAIGDPDTLALGLTCRLFYTLFVRAHFRRVSDIGRLHTLVVNQRDAPGNLPVGSFIGSTVRTRLAWYCAGVRDCVLQCSRDHEHLFVSVLSEFGPGFRFDQLMPRLASVHLRFGTLEDMDSFIPRLTFPALISMTVTIGTSTPAPDTALMLYRPLLMILPRVDGLDIANHPFGPNTSSAFLSSLHTDFPDLSQLRILQKREQMPSQPLPFSSLLHIANINNLKELAIGPSQIGYVEPVYAQCPQVELPNLEQLELSFDPRIPILLSCMCAPNLKRVNVSIRFAGSTELFPIIAAQFPLLESLVISYSDAQLFQQADSLRPTAILRDFVHCVNLIELVLEVLGFLYPLIVSDDDLDALSTNSPNLRILRVRREPTIGLEPLLQDPSTAEHPTLWGLSMLAKRCRALEVLELPVALVWPAERPHNSCPFVSLKRFLVRDIAFYDKAEARKFFYDISPKLNIIQLFPVCKVGQQHAGIAMQMVVRRYDEAEITSQHSLTAANMHQLFDDFDRILADIRTRAALFG